MLEIPLYYPNLDPLDAEQLADLEAHLLHPSALADPSTDLLRRRVRGKLIRDFPAVVGEQ